MNNIPHYYALDWSVSVGSINRELSMPALAWLDYQKPCSESIKDAVSVAVIPAGRDYARHGKGDKVEQTGMVGEK